MFWKRSSVIRTLVTAAAAVTLALGAAQLSAGTALAATAHSSSAAAHSAAAQPAATHFVIWSEDLPSEEACYVQGEAFLEYGLALDFFCFPTVVRGACTNTWTLELELPGAHVSLPAKPALPAC
jgi:hypothetical protein